jgi:hypothetical protein
MYHARMIALSKWHFLTSASSTSLVAIGAGPGDTVADRIADRGDDVAAVVTGTLKPWKSQSQREYHRSKRSAAETPSITAPRNFPYRLSSFNDATLFKTKRLNHTTHVHAISILTRKSLVFP